MHHKSCTWQLKTRNFKACINQWLCHSSWSWANCSRIKGIQSMLDKQNTLRQTHSLAYKYRNLKLRPSKNAWLGQALLPATFLRGQGHVIDGRTNGGRKATATPVLPPPLQRSKLTSCVSVWWRQIRNRGIIAIVEPFLTRITHLTTPKHTMFCWGQKNVSHSEIKPTIEWP